MATYDRPTVDGGGLMAKSDDGGVVRASIDNALRVARESMDAGGDAVRRITDALQVAANREASADDRSEAAKDVVRSSLEVAQRVASESLDAATDTAKELQAAIRKALDGLGEGSRRRP
jgi:hypothetical protein